MKKLLIALLSLGTTCALLSCAQVAGKKGDFKLRQREAEYASVAREFVERAIANDPDGMIQLTSTISIKTMGSVIVRRAYVEGVIPFFKGGRVEWSGKHRVITDDVGNRGFAIFGNIAGKGSPFSITVMRESSVLKVINILAH